MEGGNLVVAEAKGNGAPCSGSAKMKETVAGTDFLDTDMERQTGVPGNFVEREERRLALIETSLSLRR